MAEGCDGSDLANAPSWLGAMDSGPLRLNRYSRPMPSLPQGVEAILFSDGAPLMR
ncbi:hypothetical protein D3C78_1019230 [compost metagenome]